MSMNFTGSTGKRNVNLGKRSLMGRNKSAFLKSAQEEREKREAMRIQDKAATVLQAAFKRKQELDSWRRLLAQNWDGRSVLEFMYFFPYLCQIQDFQVTQSQLEKLIEIIPSMSEREKSILLIIIIRSFCDFEDRKMAAAFAILVSDKLELLLKGMTIPVVSHDLRASFTKKLLDLYLHHSKTMLFYLFHFKKLNCTEELIPLLTNLEVNPFMDACSENFLSEFLSGEVELIERLTEVKSTITELPDDEKIAMISYFSKILKRDHESVIEIAMTRLIPSILKSISHPIVINYETTTDERFQNSQLKDSQLLVSKLLFDDVSYIFQKNALFVPLNCQIEYISSLLHFTSLISNDHGALKTQVTLDWVLDGSTELINLCFSAILNIISHFKDSDNIPNSVLKQLIIPINNQRYWECLLIFQEFLMSIISYTPDTLFYDQMIISKSELILFIKFMKLFISQVLMKYRELDVVTDQFFLNSFRKLLALTHAFYMKNLTLKFVNSSFWIISNFDLEFSSVMSTIPIIDSIHQNLMLNDYASTNIHGNDFLKTIMFTNFFKSIPKKVVDTYYILTYASYMIPFAKRAELFHAFIEYDKRENDVNGWYPTKVEGTVSRDNLLFDAYKSFGHLRGRDFKKPFSVQFINQFGEAEAGIDGGGLTKELLTSLVETGFVPSQENRKANKNLQFFKTGTDYKLYFNPEFYFKVYYQKQHPEIPIPYACSNPEYLDMCHFLGMVIGKCLYDNVLLDISFAPFFLNICAKMAGKMHRNLIGDKLDFMNNVIGFSELKSMDMSLYSSMNYILGQTDAAKFSHMALDFSVDDEFYDMNGIKYHVTIPLPNNDTPLTHVDASNKMEFVKSIINFKINSQTKLQMNEFTSGLFEVIKPHWLLLFDSNELQTLISGDSDDIDLEDLKRNISYGGGYTANDRTIQDLFEVLSEFDRETIGKFIKFVTSSSKKPLLGFKELTPKFGIFNAGNNHNRLPTASTCVNLLKLPNYRDRKLLKEKLLYSINSKAGFDLS